MVVALCSAARNAKLNVTQILNLRDNIYWKIMVPDSEEIQRKTEMLLSTDILHLHHFLGMINVM